MISKLIKTLGISLTLLGSLPALSGYSRLSDTRSQIKFPKYSLQQKKLVLDQAKLILNEMYVNREFKIKEYGASANPVPALIKIENNIHALTDEDFHKKMKSVFSKFRDLHTLYFLPRPYACYESFLPFSFTKVKLGQEKNAFAVSNIATSVDVLSLLPKPLKVQLGDSLISYNGVSAQEAVEKGMLNSIGANPAAAKRRALDDMRYLQHDLNFVPKDNTVKLVFQNSKGEQYLEEIPWIVYANENCLENINPGIEKSRRHGKYTSFNANLDEPILYWQVSNSIHGRFGYIELLTFTPTNSTVEEVVSTIQKLLLNELKATDGLIFDVRSNPGGQLPMAEKLIQLFTPSKVTPSLFTMKNTETNYVYMHTSDATNPFTEILILARQLGSAFTKPIGLSTFDEINDLGQVYFKPVAIFVDSKCYSACETFAAQAQDHQSATIFGEEPNTGGGGANTYSLNQIMEEFSQTEIGPFKNLIFGQNIQFGFRQAIRVGINAGKLIENVGVQVDKLARPQMSDIFNRTNDQQLIIQSFLKSKTRKYNSHIYFHNEERHDFKQHSKPSFFATWKNSSLFVFKENGETIESRNLNDSGRAMIDFPDSISTHSIRNGRLEIIGSHQNKNVWRKILNYRIIPDWTRISEDHTDLMGNLALYSNNTAEGEGWNLNGDSLTIGNGLAYKNDVHAEASLFLKLSLDKYQVNFAAQIDTEQDLDYFKVIAISDKKEVTLLDKQSGTIPFKLYSLNLSQFRGKKVELRFVFKSDPGWVSSGVTIKNITISR